MRQTSIESYHSIRCLGQQQKLVLWYIRNFPDHTDRELTKLIGYADPNKVRPRRKELLDAGLIRESGVKTCSVSGKKALTWRTIK